MDNNTVSIDDDEQNLVIDEEESSESQQQTEHQNSQNTEHQNTQKTENILIPQSENDVNKSKEEPPIQTSNAETQENVQVDQISIPTQNNQQSQQTTQNTTSTNTEGPTQTSIKQIKRSYPFENQKSDEEPPKKLQKMNTKEAKQQQMVSTDPEKNLPEPFPSHLYPKLEKSQLSYLGSIKYFVQFSIVIEGEKIKAVEDKMENICIPQENAIAEETVVFTEDGTPIGKICDVFGPVLQPYYSVKFHSKEEMASLQISQKLFYSKEYVNYIEMVGQNITEDVRIMNKKMNKAPSTSKGPLSDVELAVIPPLVSTNPNHPHWKDVLPMEKLEMLENMEDATKFFNEDETQEEEMPLDIEETVKLNETNATKKQETKEEEKDLMELLFEAPKPLSEKRSSDADKRIFG